MQACGRYGTREQNKPVLKPSVFRTVLDSMIESNTVELIVGFILEVSLKLAERWNKEEDKQKWEREEERE